jgi:uncharacterized protein YjbI with pentapeptide repeats
MFDRPGDRYLDVRSDGDVRPDGSGTRTTRVLRPDCEKCVGLCCVAPAFSTSADFAIDKAAGEPCPNLQADFRCGIHASLRDRGFRGCTAYDCFGAGQRVAREVFAGADWRAAPDISPSLFAAFSVDLTGADVRGADLSGADLRDALFLVQSQVDSAQGDRRTRLPPSLCRPAHWA